MSNPNRKWPKTRRVIDALSGLLIGAVAAGGVVLLAAGPIMNLPGKVDSNNALVVASVSPGTIGSQGRPIANLPGKVDANNALVVTLASGSEISSPVFVNQIGFTGTAGVAADLILARDAANTLALRNGTANQEFRVGPAGDYLRILKNNAGAAFLQTVNSTALTFGTADTGRWSISTAGHLQGVADNTYDIGASGATRPRAGYFGTSLSAPQLNAPAGQNLDFGANNVASLWRLNTSGHLLAVTDNTYDIGASGATRPRSIYVGTSVLAAGPTGGVGYTTGAGGAVTQITSKSTGVTLNTVTGNITMEAGSLAANTAVSFTLTDSAIAATDLVVVTHHSGGTAGAYTVVGQAAAGSAVITLRNVTAGALAEAVVLKFAVIKGAVS